MRVALGAVLLAAVLLVPGVALAADQPPHVTTEEGPDACAMCHRAHTARGVVARSQSGSWDTTGSALVIADPSSNAGDAALCLTCHGIEGFGSRLIVQDDFIRDSAHTLLPDASRYEEVPDKQCSSCHDAHGSEKRDDGTPFPGLLRALTEDGDPFYAGEAYCATCHYDARDDYNNRFDGLSIYEQTAHFGLPYPASGTQITCSNCHASHGSDVAPLIAAEIVPPVVAPAIPETATITANDRTVCYACHADAQATWLGREAYDDEATETVHGSSDVALPVTAEYASEETTRLAGECQSCHNPMGSDNGEGAPIAKLAEFEGRELCYSCHNEENAADITDMKSFGVFPDDIAGEPELVVSWDPANLPAAYGGLHVYTRAFGDDEAPYGLEGPRRYKPTTGLNPPRTGAIAYGDIDVSGETALVVADPATPVLRVFRPSKLAGLVEDEGVNGSIIATATALAVGDFAVNGDGGLPEVAALSVEAGGESFVRLYRWKANGLSGSFDPVASYPVGWDATGLAAGNLGTDKENALVVTARSEEATDSAGAVFVLYRGNDDSGLTVEDPFPTVAAGPRGPSIGPVLNGEPGIVVANAGATVPSISVYSPDGDSHEKYPVFDDGGVAWETVVGDFMSGGATGVAVAVRSENGNNAVSIFPAVGAELGTSTDVLTGASYATSSLAVGSLTADTTQIVVGNAGVLSHVEGESVYPSTQVITWTGSSFQITPARPAGGTELAGNTPALAVVDLGPVGRSRHPASAIEGAHVSTETAGFDRHAECVDCHNVHAATAEPADNAPFAYGAIAGTWGLDVASDSLVEVVEREYEMCFKCHASADWGFSPRNIAIELDSGNAGFHPVMDASSKPVNQATLVNGWQPGSQMYCIDCHGNAGAGPEGPHVSPEAPLLSRPYIGSTPDDDEMLCYGCHKYAEYHADPGPPIVPLGTGSLFYDNTLDEPHLHKKHVGLHGLGCETCHVSHGGKNYRLIRDDVDWVEVTDGGACYTSCHGPGTVNAYSRTEPESGVDPSSVEVRGSFDGAYVPTVSLIHFQDGVNLTVREKAGTVQPVLQVEIAFAGVTETPARLELHGWYDGPGITHTVNVQAWDYDQSEFVTIGQLPPALAPSAHYWYALGSSAYVSGGNQMLIRIDHASQGNSGHYLHLDRVWLSY